MTIEKLTAEMIAAMKSGNKARKSVISGLIDAVKKASITPKGKIEITELLVDEVLIKCQKMAQESYDSCPKERVETLNELAYELEVIKEFAPQLITDPSEIAVAIHTIAPRGVPFIKSNKGVIMKAITPYFKGKADMKIVNQVVGEMLE